MATHVDKTDQQWREELTPDQYEVLREGATERAFTGRYWDAHEDGIYRCAGCGAELFCDVRARLRKHRMRTRRRP